MSTASRVSRLESALTRRGSVTPLSSTLTRPSRKNIKTWDFNSISCHTYEGSPRKSFRCRTYKKGVGGGGRFLRGPIWLARALFASPDSIRRGGGTRRQSPVPSHGLNL